MHFKQHHHRSRSANWIIERAKRRRKKNETEGSVRDRTMQSLTSTLDLVVGWITTTDTLYVIHYIRIHNYGNLYFIHRGEHSYKTNARNLRSFNRRFDAIIPFQTLRTQMIHPGIWIENHRNDNCCCRLCVCVVDGYWSSLCVAWTLARTLSDTYTHTHRHTDIYSRDDWLAQIACVCSVCWQCLEHHSQRE